MKDWWLNLALREKQTVAAGSFVVVLFLLYTLIWSPLSDLNDNLRTRIPRSQETLSAMQSTDQLIQHITKEVKEKRNQPTGSLLGLMQTEINQSKFASHVTQLRQAENDSVQFNLRKVDFDQLLVFLTSLWKKQGVIISQITVIPMEAPGEVTVDITVKR